MVVTSWYFDLTIHSIAGPLCTVERVLRDVTFYEVKHRIQKKSGIPWQEQRLYQGTTRIRDEDKVELHLQGEDPRITMIRKRPIKLPPHASPAEWLALYNYEYGHRPPEATALRDFCKNRGHNMSYMEARKTVQAYADPSKVLVDLPVPKEPSPSPETGHQCDAVPTADNACPKEDPVTLLARYRDIGSLGTDVCVICLVEGGCDAVELLCEGSHRFHKECIEGWFQGEQCPRTDVAGTVGTGAESWGLFERPDTNGRVIPKDVKRHCPVCRGQALGKAVVARRSGVFCSKPGSSGADAAFRK